MIEVIFGAFIFWVIGYYTIKTLAKYDSNRQARLHQKK